MARDTLVEAVAEAIRAEGAQFTYHDDFLFASAAEAAIDAIRDYLIAQAGQDVVMLYHYDSDPDVPWLVPAEEELLADWLRRTLSVSIV